MDLRAEKLKLIELLLHTNNPSIIKRIKSIFQAEETQDIWEQLSDDQQHEINKALEEVKNGEIVPIEIFIEKHK
ncbi:MAG: hypothetical protein AAGA77_16015 [Bacteroidota bacterium]